MSLSQNRKSYERDAVVAIRYVEDNQNHFQLGRVLDKVRINDTSAHIQWYGFEKKPRAGKITEQTRFILTDAKQKVPSLSIFSDLPKYIKHDNSISLCSKDIIALANQFKESLAVARESPSGLNDADRTRQDNLAPDSDNRDTHLFLSMSTMEVQNEAHHRMGQRSSNTLCSSSITAPLDHDTEKDEKDTIEIILDHDVPENHHNQPAHATDDRDEQPAGQNVVRDQEQAINQSVFRQGEGIVSPVSHKCDSCAILQRIIEHLTQELAYFGNQKKLDAQQKSLEAEQRQLDAAQISRQANLLAEVAGRLTNLK